MTKIPYTTLVAALIAGGALSPAAQAQSMPELKFSGFGTVGAAHSSEKRADFIATDAQPKGAGASGDWSFNPDTRLGLQASAQFTDKLSAVVQVITQYQANNSYTPNIEWANIKYRVTDDFSVRLGRIAAPTYLLAETRYVNYASTWIRPPGEVYSVMPVSSNDGVDATWRTAVAGGHNSLQGYAGQSTFKFSTGRFKATEAWGVNDSFEIGSLTLRAGYTDVTYTMTEPRTAQLITGLQQFAAGAAAFGQPTAAAQAQSLADRYSLTDMKMTVVALGAIYDPGDWFVMGEFISAKGKKGLTSDNDSWYLHGGYRIGAFTPYAIFSSVRAKIRNEPGITPTGLPGFEEFDATAVLLSNGVNQTLNSYTGTQSTTAIGLRWDAASNVALKGQFQRLNLGTNSRGRLGNPQADFVPGGNVNVISVALDFIF